MRAFDATLWITLPPMSRAQTRLFAGQIQESSLCKNHERIMPRPLLDTCLAGKTPEALDPVAAHLSVGVIPPGAKT